MHIQYTWRLFLRISFLSLSLYLALCVSLSLYLSWMLLTHCQDHILAENIWFVWSRTADSGDKWRCYRCGTYGRQTNEQGKIGLLSQWMLDGWVSQFGSAVWQDPVLPQLVPRGRNCLMSSKPNVLSGIVCHLWFFCTDSWFDFVC